MTIELPSGHAAAGVQGSGAGARARADVHDAAEPVNSFEQALSAADEAPAESAADVPAAAARHPARKTAEAPARDASGPGVAEDGPRAPVAESGGTGAAGNGHGHRAGARDEQALPAASDNALLLAQSALSAAAVPAVPPDAAPAGAGGSSTGGDAAGAGIMPIGRAVPRGPVSVQALGTTPVRAEPAPLSVPARTGGAGALTAKAADGASAHGVNGTNGANGAAARGADAQAGNAAQPDGRQLAPQDAAQQAPAAAASAEQAAQQAAADPEALVRHADRPDERKGASDALPGLPSGSGATASSSVLMAPVDPASAAASAGQSGLADRMLEQVSWWLSHKTQGAELTLDVARGHSVSVSVQVQGNEAHVAFRSDQPEVRQMLGQAMPQLKEMLGSEGLMLSGSSVGSHADSQGRGAAQEAAAPWRTAADGALASSAPVSAAVGAPRATSGRALDLYV